MNGSVQPPDDAHLQAAVHWLQTLKAPGLTAEQYQAWQAWISASPEHARAWARIEKLQQQVRGVPQERVQPMLGHTGMQRRDGLRLLAVLAASAALMGGYRALPMSADLATRTGERRMVPLSDGSRLELNTDTWVDLEYAGRERLVRLRRGEIFVNTAADYPPGRPFSVLTPHGRVLALGTRFNVRLDQDSSTVTVESRAVEVHLHDAPQAVRRVEEGQALTFGFEQMSDVRGFEQQALAWTRGLLVVDKWRLEDFVSELARYHPGYLGCATDVAGLRISGVFRLDDLQGVLAGLPALLPVKVRRLAPWWVRIEG